MVAAIIFVCALGMDVVCGWQPMPDGSASYECVVQLEPAVIGTLRPGDSIPLSVEVPDHVQPIRRIRITVGDGQVPRHDLAAAFKPWPESDDRQSREGLVETQYSTPRGADNRYTSPQALEQPVLPPGQPARTNQDAFARALQDGSQRVGNAVADVSQDVLPPETGRRMADSFQRAGQQLGNDLRNVANTTRDESIRQLFGDGSQNGSTTTYPSNQDTSSSASGAAILPPGTAPPAGGSTSQPILPADTNLRRVDQPIEPGQVGQWPSNRPGQGGTQNPSATNSQRYAGGSNHRGTIGGNAQLPTTIVSPPSTPGDQQARGSAPPFVPPQQNVTPPADRYARAETSPANSSTAEGISNSSIAPNQTASETAGPGFPPFTPTANDERGQDQYPVTNDYPAQTRGPEIRRDMLNDPPSTDAATRGSTAPASTTTAAQQPTAGQLTTANDFGWNTAQQQQPTSPGSPTNLFPLVLSWVLLSGSGAGNFYLLWSYLDVRNKYRDLVHDASRKFSRRYADTD